MIGLRNKIGGGGQGGGDLPPDGAYCNDKSGYSRSNLLISQSGGKSHDFELNINLEVCSVLITIFAFNMQLRFDFSLVFTLYAVRKHGF